MKRFLVLTVSLLSAVIAFAQQEIKSGDPLAFNRVEFTGNVVVKLIKADTGRIEIKLNNAEINRLDWGVKDGNLHVKLKPGASSVGSADVVLYYTSVESLKLSGANVSVADTLSAEMLNVEMSAGAVLGAPVAAKDLWVKASGNSSATLTGHTKYYTLIAGSKAKVDSRNLQALDARVESASGAEVYVYATERLQMTADTGGAIFYRGEPAIVRSATKMMGTINSIGK